MGEAVIVAGIGCRKGVAAEDVVAAVEAAVEQHGLEISELAVLATTAFKRNETAIFEAGKLLALSVIVVKTPGQGKITPTLTHSPLSLSVAGTPSVSEAAALAAAGPNARLAGPRTVVGAVTCAIAFGGDQR